MEDLEQLVIRGLEIEKIEKAKAAERRLLTKKNGLKVEEAKYVQTEKGQTRDIVAKQLGMSGRQWEKVKYIYFHKHEFERNAYEGWRRGLVSTSLLYKACNGISVQRHNQTLINMQREIGAFLDRNCVRNTENAIKEELFNYKMQKDKILPEVEKDRKNIEKFLWDTIEQLEQLKLKS